MIGFMPQIYPDELVYSWIARYFCHSGYDAYVYALEDVMARRTMPDILFLNEMSVDFRKVSDQMIPREDLVLRHTMFPLFRFFDKERRQDIFQALLNSRPDFNRLARIRTGGDWADLRYCPLCAKEDRELYGETYWHRSAIIPGISVCPKHGCRLAHTGIPLTGKTRVPRMYIAEMEIPELLEAEYPSDDQEHQYARYVEEIFNSEVNLDSATGISDFLSFRLQGTEYVSVRGRKRNIRMLTDDLNRCFRMEEEQAMKYHQVQKCFTGYSWKFADICRIGFLLKIPADNLKEPEIPEFNQTEVFDARVRELTKKGLGCYRISSMMNVSPSTVKKVRSKRGKASDKKSNYRHDGHKGISREDWTEMDRELLPHVEEACKKLFVDENGRPRRVCQKSVERYLHLPEGRLICLPSSYAVVKSFYESQEEYWAREVIWAYRKLIEDERELNYTGIRKLTNIRRENLCACVPFLSKFESAEEVRALSDLCIPESR